MSKKNVIRGTISQLIEQGFTINGERADQPTLSVLTRLGFAKAVEKIKPTGSSGRGKPATVWEFDKSSKMAFNLNPSAVQDSGESANQPVAESESAAEPEQNATAEVKNDAEPAAADAWPWGSEPVAVPA